MRFADELVEADQLDLPATGKSVRKAELDMATTLVEGLAADWKPSKYIDEYRQNLMRIIQGKAKGKKVHLESPAEPREAKVVDLMERLRQSLAQNRGAKTAGRRQPKAVRSTRPVRATASTTRRRSGKRPSHAA